MTWYQAAKYCNWLSEQEGIPAEQWCYDPSQPFADGMRLPSDYLQRTGYWLPTAAEWEYACRALTTTARYFGQRDTLLDRYAWYTKNALDRWMLPVGSLPPNTFGLSDMLGNAVEWCQDVPRLYDTDGSLVDDTEQAAGFVVRDAQRRVLRGGSFSNNAPAVRSALRSNLQPDTRLNTYGFRVARTYP